MASVYVVRCGEYDPARIDSGVRTAAQALGVALPTEGNVLLVTDIPWAHTRFAPHAYTHPGVVEGVARTCQGTTLTISGCSLPDFPTRYSYRQAGYDGLARRLGARLLPLDEARVRTFQIGPEAKVTSQVHLPEIWFNAAMRICLPKLRTAARIPFAGAARHLQSLLPQAEQLEDIHRLPEKIADLLPAVKPDLIVVDAIKALHNGGELSGDLADLNLLIVGTDALAVDYVCAAALGLDPNRVDFLQEAASRGLSPASFDEITLLGDYKWEDLRAISDQIRLANPLPEKYPLPDKVRVVRSEKARQAGSAGELADLFYLLEKAGISWKSAPEAVIVIGAVQEIPAPVSDTAAVIFIDDTSRGDFSGYSRVVRLTGRNVPMSKLLIELPFALKIINLRAELGSAFILDQLVAKLAKLSPK